jgi:hypothetical protein
VAKAADALNNPIVFLQEMPGVEYIVDSELVSLSVISIALVVPSPSPSLALIALYIADSCTKCRRGGFTSEYWR